MRKYFVLLTGAALAAQAALASHGRADEAGEAAALSRIARNFTRANAETCFNKLIAQERAARQASMQAIDAQLLNAERLAGDRLAGKAPPPLEPYMPPGTVVLPNGLVLEPVVKDITSYDDPATGTWCSGSPNSSSYTFGVVSKLADGRIQSPLFATNAKSQEMNVIYPTSDRVIDIIKQQDQLLDQSSFSRNGARLARPFQPDAFSQKENAFISGWIKLSKLLAAKPFADLPVKPAGKPAAPKTSAILPR